MKGIDELFIVAWMLFGILLTPLFFIAFDLWAGIRKAKQRSEKISSDGWKRTVNKVARYYNALLALVVVDCMQMAGVWYLDTINYDQRKQSIVISRNLYSLYVSIRRSKSSHYVV